MSDAVLSAPKRFLDPSWPRAWRLALPGTRRLSGLPRGRLSAGTMLAFAALASAVTLLAFAAATLARLHDRAVALPQPAPIPPEWADVPRPIHIFDLDAPVLRGMQLVYTARRRSAGDGREDTLAFGTTGRDAPALRLRLYRRGSEPVASTPLFAAVARQAAEASLSVQRSGLADLMPTRFGNFEIADVTLVDASAAAVPCSGFRLALHAPAFTISGLACGVPGRPIARTTLACMVDRLDLASGGEDKAMIDFFAVSEKRRDPACSGARLAPDAMHAAWLDDKPVTHAKTSRRH